LTFFADANVATPAKKAYLLFYMILIILFIFLFISYAFLLMRYKRGWNRQGRQIALPAKEPSISVSVIIPARNEADNIATCIRSVLNNDYPATLLEIIVIDDFSEDDTAEIAGNLLQQGHGRVIRLKDHLSKDERLNSYKKKALKIAIGEAKGEWIITTDADCEVPVHWLQQLTGPMQSERIKFIAAPVSFTPALPRPDGLYYFQSLDFMTMQGITAASIAMNLGNMCNGANLAFSKKAFDEVGGYKGIDHIASGDDMLLMHKIQLRFPDGIFYLKSKEAIVHTPAQPDWRSFLNQRIRWSSKADKYEDKKLTVILAFVYFFNVSFIPMFIAGFFNYFYWLWMFGILFAKVFIELIFLVPVAGFYGKKKELWWFPIFQPMHIGYIIMAGFLGKFGSYQWKGRTVK
jgi:cellulose synthase/poly-beta-1,6-N-acetylglucosamine synthase-like glycosyltransferase